MEVSLELQHFSILQDKKLEKILDTLQAKGVSGAEAAKSHLEKTQVNSTTKVKTELLKLHKDYQEPLCTPEKWTEILNYRAKEARERQRHRVIEKHYEGISAELDVETPRVITLPPSPNLPSGYSFLREADPATTLPELQENTSTYFELEKTTQTREYGRVIAYNPYSGAPIPIPLQFANIVSLDTFKRGIHLLYLSLIHI